MKNVPFTSSAVRRVPSSRVLQRLVAVLTVTCSAGFLASATGFGGWSPIVAGVVFVLTTLVARRTATRDVPESGTLCADANGIRWNGALISRSRIRGGVYLPRSPLGPAVLIDLEPYAHMELLVADEAEGTALLRALGVNVTQVTAAFVALGRITGFYAALTLLAAGVVGIALTLGMILVTRPDGPVGASHLGATTLLAMILFVLPHALHLPWTATTHVVVGRDGLLLTRLGRRRFIPYASLSAVGAYTSGVALTLTDGSVVHLRTLTSGPDMVGALPAQLATREALLGRIRAAMGAVDSEGTAVVAAALQREGRSARAWVASLRGLAQRAEGGMRSAPVPREHLWRALGDAQAGEEIRAGAAIALASAADEATRERLHAAAQSIASPRLRVVLDVAATDASELEVSRALDELDAAGAEAERARMKERSSSTRR